MSSILDFLKATTRLSSLPFVIGMFGIGVVLLNVRRTRRAGRVWLTCVWLGFWIASTPLGSTLLSWPVATRARPIQSRAEARGATTVVMLGGGTISYVAYGIGVDDLWASAPRIIETVRLYRLLDHPLVIVSGGDTQHLTPPRTEAAAYRDAALRLGVPSDRIVMEDRSQTTHDEAVELKRMLSERGIGTFVVVTSPTHMPRSLRTLRAVGLDPVPSPAPLRTVETPLWSPVPDRQSMAISDQSLYDALALVYYRLRGWI